MSSLASWQTQDILVLERTASGFSLVGLTFIFSTFIFSRRFRGPVNRLIFYASWGNLLMAVATMMSVSPALLDNPKEAPLCRFQGFLIQTFLPADAFWNLSIAINVYLMVFRKWPGSRLRKLEPVYILLNYGLTFAVAFTYIFIDDGDPGGWGRMYGPATLWCWVDEKWDQFRIWACYLPAWVCIVVIFIVYIFAWIDIFRKRKALDAEARRSAQITFNRADTQLQEVRVTTEIRRTSFQTPLNSPRIAIIAEVSSKRLFNPFSLDPTNLQGYDPYSITIERGGNAEAAKKRAAAREANVAAWAYTRTALLYFLSLLVTWVPSSINRVYSFVNPGSVSFPFSVMAGLVLPLMGFWNFVIYFVTSWDAVVAMSNDLMLKERGSALFGRRSRSSSEDTTWIEVDDTRLQQKGDTHSANADGSVTIEDWALRDRDSNAEAVSVYDYDLASTSRHGRRNSRGQSAV